MVFMSHMENKAKLDLLKQRHVAKSMKPSQKNKRSNSEKYTPEGTLLVDNEHTKEAKLEQIEGHFSEIMKILGLDLQNASLKGTPRRVAKMYVNEIFYGLEPARHPSISLFENDSHYKEMILEKHVEFCSFCEHHFLPIIGHAHVAYIPNKKLIGLSKINRLVRYYAARPQVQERLTTQICEAMQTLLESSDIAVQLEASHTCVKTRGVEDRASSTVTSAYLGVFSKPERRLEFLRQVSQEPF